MLKALKKFLRRYPGLFAALVRIRQSVNWQLYMFGDWRDTYLPHSRNEMLTRMGFKLVSGSYMANRQMLTGTFEPEETAIIQQHLRDAQIFVDVGANIGMYTCLARSLGKYAIAVEPQPRNLDYLYVNLITNNWADTEVYPLGLNDQPGLVTLYGASGPSASLISGWAGYSKRFRQLIPVTTLDALLGERFSGRKLLIKIDVEGAEYAVLRGAEKTIQMSPHPTWMIEVCLNEFHPGGINPNYAATFEMFWRNGYEARTADRRNLLVRPDAVSRWISAGRNDTGTFNYLFTPIA